MPTVSPKGNGCRRLLRWGLVGVGIALVAMIALGIFLAARIPRKASAPHVPSAPVRGDALVGPIPQFESHTCGLLALSAAYRKYGLSPEDENLRFRLGVDRPANPLDGSTTGTLHPDLFRVLGQDGFAYQSLDPEAAETPAALRAHLEGGQAALLLIARPENGNLHWVMTDAWGDEGNLRVVDSLREEAHHEPAEDFLREHVLSIVALRPAPDGDHAGTVSTPHADGLAEMERVRRRLGKR